jgi:hypothetical protein
MYLAGMKVHDEIDLLDVRSSSVGIRRIVFFWPPAAFYARAARLLLAHEPSVARLLDGHDTVTMKQYFQTGRFRTCSRRRPHLTAFVHTQGSRQVRQCYGESTIAMPGPLT